MKIIGVNVNSAVNFPYSKGDNGLLEKLRNTHISEKAELSGVDVDISKDAQRLLRLMRQEDVEAAQKTRYEDFVSDYIIDVDEVLHYTEESEHFHSIVGFYFSNKSFKSAREDLYAHTNSELRSIFEYGAQLSKGIAHVDRRSEFRVPGDDTQNLTLIANRYSELKRDIEERYSGEELEKHLDLLSKAFDLTVGVYGRYRELSIQNKISMEMKRIGLHNSGDPLFSNLFNRGIITMSSDEMEDIYKKVTFGLKEEIARFANHIKQFVLENGAVTSEESETALLTHLSSIEPPDGGYTLDRFTAINDILGKPITANRKVTLFDELKIIFN